VAKSLQKKDIFGETEEEELEAFRVGEVAGESCLRQIIVNSTTRRSLVWTKEVCENVKKNFNLTVSRTRARGLIRKTKESQKKGELEKSTSSATTDDGRMDGDDESDDERKEGDDESDEEEASGSVYDPSDSGSSSSEEEVVAAPTSKPARRVVPKAKQNKKATVSSAGKRKTWKPIGPLEQEITGKYVEIKRN
jgi:hypothetical protein